MTPKFKQAEAALSRIDQAMAARYCDAGGLGEVQPPVHVPTTTVAIQRFNGSPLPAPEEAAVEAEAVCTEEHRGGQRITEALFRDPQSSSVFLSPPPSSSVQLPGGGAWTIPADTIPTAAGQRNDCLFRLARHARAIQPAPTPEELRLIVRAWHERAQPAMKTQDFAVSLAEFMHAYERVRQPHGAVMKAIIDNIGSTPLPAGIEKLGYGEAGNLLVRFCAALQQHAGNEPFFLGARQAGELIGAPFTDANRMLQALALDGVVTVTTKGAGRKASRYRYVWPAPATSLEFTASSQEVQQ